MSELEIEYAYSYDLKQEGDKKQKCPDDRSQCFEYADVVPNPRINNQSNNVNKNRWHREPRIRPLKDGKRKKYFHTGVDILADSGTIIYSLLCGEVIELRNSFSPNQYQAESLGNYITIKSKDKDGKDVWIKYCHLDGVSVKKGDKIKHGDVIGISGSTGNAASILKNGKLTNGILPQYRHIHIEVATSVGFGSTRIDPEPFMKTKFDETTDGNPIPSEEEEIETVENDVEKEIRERELEKIKQPIDNLRIEKRPLPLEIKKIPKL